MSNENEVVTTTLDHIDTIVVPGDPFKQATNEYYALIFLARGLDVLFRQVSECDEHARQKLNPEGELKVCSMGNDPHLDRIPRSLLYCAFHWYAITACQYVRTVGAIARRLDSARPLPPEYVRKVIPEVLVFRDKIAAHFAWTTKNSQDSEAERKFSIMPTLTFQNDAFYMGAWTLSVQSNGKASDSSALTPWSVSGVHQRLQQRYWPPRESSSPD